MFYSGVRPVKFNRACAWPTAPLRRNKSYSIHRASEKTKDRTRKVKILLAKGNNVLTEVLETYKKESNVSNMVVPASNSGQAG